MIQLRNKKSGKTATLVVDGALKYVQAFAVEDDSMERLGEYKTLAELNAEWEDVPEDTKDFWYIRCGGAVKQNEDSSLEKHHIDKHKEIGNYFSTREEAEKAVERLCAWQRLKDKGFKPKGWVWEDDPSKIEIKLRCPDETCLSLYDIQDDLDLLFGGEND